MYSGCCPIKGMGPPPWQIKITGCGMGQSPRSFRLLNPPHSGVFECDDLFFLWRERRRGPHSQHPVRGSEGVRQHIRGRTRSPGLREIIASRGAGLGPV
jgi:hypothetical protein